MRLLLAAAIAAGAPSAHAASLGTPGTSQVEYTLGESGADFVNNFQDASGNSRHMTGGAGVDYAVGTTSWNGGGIPSGSTSSLMIADGKAKWGMSNTAGISADYQVSIFVDASDDWPSAGTAGAPQTIFEMDGVSFTRQGGNYVGVVNGNTLGTFNGGTGWRQVGLMFQKVGDVFSFWTSVDRGLSWIQQGGDLTASGVGVNWGSIHLFVKPGGGGNYWGYADGFTVRSVTLPPPGGDLIWNNGTSNFIWSARDNNWTGSTWNNTNISNAVFGSTGAGAITLGEPIMLGNMTVHAAGYTITGSTITANNSVITANQPILIASNLSGVGLAKAGAAALNISGTLDFSDSIAISEGSLVLQGGGTLGASPAALSIVGGTFDLGESRQQAGVLNLGGGTILNGTLIANSFSSAGGTISANLGGSGALTHSSGQLTLGGTSAYKGATLVQGGVLRLTGPLTVGVTSLEVSSGAKVDVDFSGQVQVNRLVLDGLVQAEGTYGSTSSTAAVKSDTWFSGPGVVLVSTQVLLQSFAASDQALANSNWAGVRNALNWLVDDTRQSAEWRSSAHLRVARSYLAEGNYSSAANVFAAIAVNPEYPKHQRDEAAECEVEANRQTQGLPGRDPETSRVRVPAAPTPGRTLYVSPAGSDSNPGSPAQPFATLGAALAANRLAGPVAGGAAIELADGIYPIVSTIALTNADSGTTGAPLTIRAANPGNAVLSGGKRLTGFQTVTDSAILTRLPAEAQGKVMQCNLAALGISDLGAIQDWNWSKPLGATVGLYVNGVPQTLARWPNTGLVPISGLVDGGDITTGRPQTISYSNDRPSRWAAAQDVWLAGYFSGPTYDGSVRIGSINTAAKTITTAWCYTAISGWPDIGGNATYYAFNLLEEIDQPGEWYLDRTSGILYWYPTGDPGTSNIDLSMFSQPMMEAGHVNHLRLEGLVFESSRGSGVTLNQSSDCIMAGCTVRNLSGVGVNINGGQRNWLIGCDLHGLDQIACSVTGGDRVNLTRGDHVVANCRIRDFGRISRTTSAGCNLAGVGNKVSHCLFQDCPAGVIGYTGNDHVVEYNDFLDCTTETDDCGSISSWGNPTFQGNVFRFNHFTHTGGGNTLGGVENRYFGQAPIRFDDAISGQIVYGNIFDHITTGGLFGAVQVNCGRDNIIDNNLVIDCPRVYSGYYGAGNERYWWYNSPYSEPPYSVTPLYVERYPKLADLYDGNGQNFIWRTASVRTMEGVQSYGNDGTWMAWSFLGNTTTSSDPGFLDGDKVNNTIEPVAFWKLGMRPIPVDEIGLYGDATRAGWIDQSTKSYWNGTSGNWDLASVLWSGTAGAASSSAWNGNGYATAVFAGAGGTVTTAAPVTVDGLAFTASGYTIAGTNPVSLNGPASEIDVGGFGATISAPLAGVGGISVAGSGTLILSGSNIYTGATRIRMGTLALSGGNNRLPAGTVVTLGDGGTTNSGILRLNGCSQQISGLLAYGSGGNNRVINGNSMAATLTMNIENGRNRFSGFLGGGTANDNNFNVVKTGQGALRLDKSIASTGGITITTGTLELNGGYYQNNRASGIFNIDHGATLAVSGGIDSYWFDNVTIQFQGAGGGTLACIGNTNSDWFNWINNDGMTIRTTGGARNTFSANAGFGLNLNNNTLVFDVSRGTDPSSDLAVSATFWNSGNITKQGNGIMTLSSTNNYGGTTAVSDGTLLVNGSTGETMFSVASGAVLGGRGTIGGAIMIQSGATLAPGSVVGTLTAGSSATIHGRLAIEIDGVVNDHLAVAGNLDISSATLGISELAGGTGQFEYIVATFGSLSGSAFAAVTGMPNGYRLEYDLVGKQIKLVKLSANITATAGSGGVALSWKSLDAGATSFTIRRATIVGGPYTVLASSITGTSYLDNDVVNGSIYYYTVQSNLGLTSDIAYALFSVAVRNLAAVSGYNTVSLSWTPVDSGMVTYTVRRATAAGGPYADLVSGVTATSYADATAVNGITYYYLVQSQSGAVSGEVSATPAGVAGALPPRWEQADIGTVGQIGSATFTSGTYTAAGAGAGAAGSIDALHFVYLPVVGDCTIIARVDSLGAGGSTSRRAGVMIRQSLNANAIEAAILVGPSGIYNTRRTSVGGNTNSSSSTSTAPRWVRMVRSGNTLTAAHSVDGANWTMFTARTVTMSGTIYVGLVVCSGNTTALNTATFSNVSVTGGYPSGLTATAGDRKIQLAWTGVTGAASYNIKRATTNGGPYTTVGTPTGITYADTTAENGTSYYYVVSAVSGAGESVNSAQVSAIPDRLPNNGVWANASGGDWSAAVNWIGAVIADDTDKTATFSLAGGGHDQPGRGRLGNRQPCVHHRHIQHHRERPDAGRFLRHANCLGGRRSHRHHGRRADRSGRPGENRHGDDHALRHQYLHWNDHGQ